MQGASYLAYVGCRTSRERNARGDGINVYRVDPAGGAWTHLQKLGDLVNPSYLAFAHGRRTLYAVHGDIIMTPGNGVGTKGMIVAPQGQVKYTGAANTEEGFIMTQKLTIDNGPTSFVGSGPGGTATSTQRGAIQSTIGDSTVSLIE